MVGVASGGWGSLEGADGRLLPQAEAAYQPPLRVPEALRPGLE